MKITKYFLNENTGEITSYSEIAEQWKFFGDSVSIINLD